MLAKRVTKISNLNSPELRFNPPPRKSKGPYTTLPLGRILELDGWIHELDRLDFLSNPNARPEAGTAGDTKGPFA